MSLRDRAEVTEVDFFRRQQSTDGGRRTTVDGRRSAAPSEPKSSLSHLIILMGLPKGYCQNDRTVKRDSML